MLASNMCGGVRFVKEINDGNFEDLYVYNNGVYK